MRFPWHLALDCCFIGQFLAYFWLISYDFIALHCANPTQNKTIYGSVQCHGMVLLMTGPYICDGNLPNRLASWQPFYELIWPIPLRTNIQNRSYMGACNAMEWFFWWQDLFNQRFGLREGQFHWNCWKNEKFLKNDPFLAKLSENPKPYTTGFSRFPG